MNANPIFTFLHSSLQHSSNSTEKFFCSSQMLHNVDQLTASFFLNAFSCCAGFCLFLFSILNLSGNISESGDTQRNTKAMNCKNQNSSQKLQTSVPVHNQFKVPCGAFN